MAEQRDEVSQAVRGIGRCLLAGRRRAHSGLQLGSAADVRLRGRASGAAPGQHGAADPARWHAFPGGGGATGCRHVENRQATVRVGAPAQKWRELSSRGVPDGFDAERPNGGSGRGARYHDTQVRGGIAAVQDRPAGGAGRDEHRRHSGGRRIGSHRSNQPAVQRTVRDTARAGQRKKRSCGAGAGCGYSGKSGRVPREDRISLSPSGAEKPGRGQIKGTEGPSIGTPHPCSTRPAGIGAESGIFATSPRRSAPRRNCACNRLRWMPRRTRLSSPIQMAPSNGSIRHLPS